MRKIGYGVTRLQGKSEMQFLVLMTQRIDEPSSDEASIELMDLSAPECSTLAVEGFLVGGWMSSGGACK